MISEIDICIYSFSVVPSYNQPKFCPSAIWNPNAVTFATNSTVGSQPYSIFVSDENTVYVADQTNNRIQVWLNGSINPTKTISGNLSNPYSLFVTTAGDIYVNYRLSNSRVDKWTFYGNTSVVAMTTSGNCFGVFVDISDTLYCSIADFHRVVKRWLNDSVTISTKIAGTGSAGSASNMLSGPQGIFVDINLDLYVADYYNGRIQLFRLGQLNAITVAGKGALNTITLSRPTGVVLDADKYLFIVDSINHRIIGSGPYGFRCLVGCSGSLGSASNQLNSPQSMTFDSYGNMFVIDRDNRRIQKFMLDTESCGKCDSI
jgi:hypothetical protein